MEKLNLITNSFENPSESKTLLLPENVKQQSLEERFNANPDDFPVLGSHKIGPEKWNINKSLSTYLRHTAELIATLDGSSIRNKDSQPADAVIYLDKSARPVNWLVNTFWDDFSNQKKPTSHHLAIDRLEWFDRVGLSIINTTGYIKGSNPDEPAYLATENDFIREVDQLPPDTYARIRSLFIKNGIENEDIETIMRTPTILDNKNVWIVDEVRHSGSSLGIAKFLIKKAIPEISSINGDYFWTETVTVQDSNSESHERMIVPGWYDATTEYGRGIGNKNQSFFDQKHNEFQTSRTRAWRFGALALGEPIDLSNEHGTKLVDHNPSRELASEIQKMHTLYRSGNIAFIPPLNYDDDLIERYIENQGFVYDNNKNNPRSVSHLIQDILNKKSPAN